MEYGGHSLECFIGSQSRVLPDDQLQEEYRNPHNKQHNYVGDEEGSWNKIKYFVTTIIID